MTDDRPAARTLMGIDPGTNRMGYAFLRVEGSRMEPLELGIIELHTLSDPYDKLHRIFEQVSSLIVTHRPEEVAFESPFFGANVQSMLKLGRAQGVAMAAALTHGLRVVEYAPSRIKQAITGRGSATKEQVAALLHSMLGTQVDPRRLDATDALAVVVCHYFLSGSVLAATERRKGLGGGLKAFSRRGSRSWEEYLRIHPEREAGTRSSAGKGSRPPEAQPAADPRPGAPKEGPTIPLSTCDPGPERGR